MRLGKVASGVALVFIFIFTFSVSASADYLPDSLTIDGARISKADKDPVKLEVNFYTPGVLPAPAVVLAHGYGGDKNSLRAQANYLREAGYVVLTYSARGFGQSTGKISMNSPEFEIADAKALIDFLATRSEVLLDASGDPRVGLVGSSYGGALSLMVAGLDKRVDAVVSDIAWNNLETALFPQNAVGINHPGVFKQLWTGLFFNVGLTGALQLQDRCGRLEVTWCEIYESVAAAGTYSQQQARLMFESSPASTNEKVTAPTLLLAGQADSLFPLSEADANYQQISTANPQTPLKMVWHSGGHDLGVPETDRLQLLTQEWLDAHLREGNSFNEDFEVTFAQASIIGTNQPTDSQAQIESAPKYLGLSNRTLTIPLAPEAQTILAPAGGVPAVISAFPGLGGFGGFLSQLIPEQTAIFQSSKLSKIARIIGSSEVKLRISSEEVHRDVVLFASLQVISESGVKSLPNGLVAPIRIPEVSSIPVEISVNLPAIAIKTQPGDSLQVVISTTDLAYRLPLSAALYKIELASDISLATGDLVLTDRGQTLWIYAWLVLGTIILISVFLRIFRPYSGSNNRSDLSEVPVAIENLVKQFKNGPLAVNDISYKIPKGKVVGLLGPNGAGKTTTMRIIMGLINPSAGAVYVYGEKVQPGAAVLSRVGSLVEGSGFLPHLSGRENLDLYWRATGRTTTSNLDEVLAIADLGTAIDRKVRTYSQGMRQRLGIAQAMLGMPDLLMLDEPTNGLDPSQIKAMREVLHRYVDSGGTVIVSSHLLSEVEQTCSYVIVMHRGQLITEGEVSQLLSGKANMRLEEFFLDVIGSDLTIGKSS